VKNRKKNDILKGNHLLVTNKVYVIKRRESVVVLKDVIVEGGATE
jgi:hypothetical protein